MNNLIKAINIYLAVYGLTLDCDKRENREFTSLGIVDKDGKSIGKVTFKEDNQYSIDFHSEEVGLASGTLEIIEKENENRIIFHTTLKKKTEDYDLITYEMILTQTLPIVVGKFEIDGSLALYKEGDPKIILRENSEEPVFIIRTQKEELSLKGKQPPPNWDENPLELILSNEQGERLVLCGFYDFGDTCSYSYGSLGSQKTYDGHYSPGCDRSLVENLYGFADAYIDGKLVYFIDVITRLFHPNKLRDYSRDKMVFGDINLFDNLSSIVFSAKSRRSENFQTNVFGNIPGDLLTTYSLDESGNIITPKDKRDHHKGLD